MKQLLTNLIHSLNQVEVKGRENMDLLLGCIMALEKLREMVKTETKEITPEEAPNDDQHQQGQNL